MFPLGSVAFPGALVPLHIFEPRYLQMIDECLDEGAGFGIVLIEKGSETGGGEERHDVGSHMVIEAAGDLAGDRRLIVGRATHRLAVQEWLPDDPYPCADTVDLDDPPAGNLDLSDTVRSLERIALLASELGHDVAGFRAEIDGLEPTAAVYRLCSLAPIGPFDAQRLLEAQDTETRRGLLDQMLHDQEGTLRGRLATGG